MLVKDACVSILSRSNNNAYILPLEYSGVLHQNVSVDGMVDILEKAVLHVKYSMEMGLVAKNIRYNSIHAMSNISCDKGLENTAIQIMLYMDISYANVVDKSVVEEFMLQMRHTSISVSGDNSSWNLMLTGVESKEALFVPAFIEDARFNGICFLTKQIDNSMLPGRMYNHIPIVNKVLTCPQLALVKGEYELDVDTFKLTILSLNVELPYNKFLLLPNGEVRICVENIHKTHFAKITHFTKEEIRGIGIHSATVFIVFVSIFIRCFRTSSSKQNNCFIVMFCAVFVVTETCRGLSKHFPLLSSACTYNAMANHFAWCTKLTMIAFYISLWYIRRTQFQSRRELSMSFPVFMFASTGIPILTVGSSIVIIYMESGRTSIGYGETNCLFPDDNSFVYTVAAPLIAVVAIFLFLLLHAPGHCFKHSDKANIDGQRETTRNLIFSILLFILLSVDWTLVMIDYHEASTTIPYIQDAVSLSTAMFLSIVLAFKKSMSFNLTTTRTDLFD